MSDTPLHPRVRDAAASYHEPGETPRDEMWQAIRAARHAPGGPAVRVRPVIPVAALQPADRPHTNGRSSGTPAPVAVPLDRPGGFGRWALAAAAVAVLALGVGLLMEWTRRPDASVFGNIAYQGWTAPGGALLPAALLAHPAAVEHLDRAGTLIAMFREDAAAGRRHPDVVAWADDLLAETRILLDSPAAGDPEVARLLADLELVLAQIAHLAGGADEIEIRLALDGIEAADMVARLRSAMPDEWLAAGL